MGIDSLYTSHWPHGSNLHTKEVLLKAQLAPAALLLANQPKSSLMKTSSTFTTMSGTAEQSIGVRGGCKPACLHSAKQREHQAHIAYKSWRAATQWSAA